MKDNVKELILFTSRVNSLIGGIITLSIMMFLNINIAIAFLLGNIISTINFALNGFIFATILRKDKSKFYLYISLTVRLTIIFMIAIILAKDLIGLLFYFLALVLHSVSIISYKFCIKQKLA